jgi:putative ubiquitin-RnfH superfamily antitoxin RatB of RatAB toxin-antitoxin module
MKISVTYALPDRQSWLDVEVAEQATVRDAIEASGIFRAFPNLDLSTQKVGIFGKPVSLEARLEAGQRVEIYRPITADPKLLRGSGSDDDSD